MTTRQAGERQTELPLFVAVADLPLPNDRVPDSAPRQPAGPSIARNLLDACTDRRRIELGYQWHSALGDRGLLPSNVGKASAEELLMIEREVCDARDQRVLDHIGCVKSSAKADL